MLVGPLGTTPSAELVLAAQPLAQPEANVRIDGTYAGLTGPRQK